MVGWVVEEPASEYYMYISPLKKTKVDTPLLRAGKESPNFTLRFSLYLLCFLDPYNSNEASLLYQRKKDFLT